MFIKRFSRIFVLCSIAICSQTGLSNAISNDYQIFNPTLDLDRYITVHSSQTLLKRQFNFGLFMDGGMNILPERNQEVATSDNLSVFPDPADSRDLGKREGYNDLLISGVGHISYGIMKGWDLGIAMPFVWQGLKEDKSKTRFSEKRGTGFRAVSKVRLSGNRKKGGIAVVGTVNIHRIQNDPFVGEPADWTKNYQLEVVGHKRFSEKFELGLNVGYRYRRVADKVSRYYRDRGVALPVNVQSDVFPHAPIGDQITASMAVGYSMNDNLRLIVEGYGAYTLEAFNGEIYRSQHTAEALLGLRWRLAKRFTVHTGVATEMIHSVGSADLRGFLGFNFSPRWGTSAKAATDEAEEAELEEELMIVEEPLPDQDPEMAPLMAQDSGESIDLYSPGALRVGGNYTPTGSCSPDGESNVNIDFGDSDPSSTICSCVDGMISCGTSINFISLSPGARFVAKIGETTDTEIVEIAAPGEQEVLVIDKIYFKTNSWTKILPISLQEIKKAAKFLESKNYSRLEIQGHTDSRGSSAYNKTLSQKRANQIKKVLVNRYGINGSNIKSIGMGEEAPIADNTTPEGLQKNRRVEFHLFYD